MRILIEVNPLLQLERTGIPNYVDQLCRGMLALDPEDRFLFWGPDLERDPLPAAPRAEFRGRGLFPRRVLEELWQQGARTGGVPADVDLYHQPAPVPPAPRLGARTRTVVTVHDLAFARYPETVLDPHYLGYVADALCAQVETADHVIADSRCTARDLQELLDVPPEKITVVHLATDLVRPAAPDFAAEKALAAAGVPERYLLCLGTLEPRKNLPSVLRAFHRLAPKMRERDLYLCLAGGARGAYQEAERLAESLGIADRLRLLGFLPRTALPLLYARARMFVYPSLYEGFGLPVLEAMTCGTPVITSTASSLPEVAGDAALLVDPLSLDELTARIEQLLDDPALAAELVRRGFAQAERFSWKRTIEETRAVYRRAAT